MTLRWKEASAPADRALRGKRIALTGRFILWTQRRLRELLLRHGGRPVARVDEQTDWVVIGGEGWPLRRGGTLTAALQRARSLVDRGQPLEVFDEEELLRRMRGERHGEGEPAPAVHRLYHLPELARIIGVSGRRLRGWVEAGLIDPVRVEEGVPQFDYSQAAAVRMLWRLTRAGVRRPVLRHNLIQLGRWLPRAIDAAGQLETIDRVMVVRDARGDLLDRSGQRWIDFDGAGAATVRFPARRTSAAAPRPAPDRRADASPADADREFDACVALESAGRWRAAVVAYRGWLDRFGADADVAFNLGNVLSELDETAAAIAAYRESLACDASRPETWNNLGNALADCGQRGEAAAAYRRALACDPGSDEARENLATLL